MDEINLSLPQLPALKSYIYRIETKIKQLNREEEIKSVIKELFLKDYHQQPNASSAVNTENVSTITKNWPCESEALTSVNKSLTCELATVQNALTFEESKTDDLTAKLSKLSVRNTNKKLKCRKS